MFGFGKKKYLPISSYPDTWAVGQGHLNGKPLVVRFKDGLKEAAGHPQYPFQIGVAIPFLNPTEQGLPTDEEATKLNVLEDSIEEALTKNDEAVFGATITTNGMRELIFYASEWKPQYFEQKVQEISSNLEHQPQFMMQEDKNWDTYRSFAK